MLKAFWSVKRQDVIIDLKSHISRGSINTYLFSFFIADHCPLSGCVSTFSVWCMHWFPFSFHGPVPGNSWPTYLPRLVGEHHYHPSHTIAADEWTVPCYPMSSDGAVLPSPRGAGHSHHSLVKYNFPLRNTRFRGKLYIPKMITAFPLYMLIQDIATFSTRGRVWVSFS